MLVRNITLVFLFCLFFLAQISSAQTFFKLTAERHIQLRLDLLRKGIQQEDTSKILMALAPSVSISGKSTNTRAALVRELQTIFDLGVVREMLLPRPNIPRADSRLSSSNFWDFDILDPKIEIRGDSAIVDCELVLWAGPTSNPAQGRGLRATERFVFVSPRVEKSPPTSTGQFQAFDSKSNRSRSTWQLAGFHGLLDLLESTSAGKESGEK